MSSNDWINDIPKKVSKEWLITYKADVEFDADLCKKYDFHSEMIEAIEILDKMIKEM